MRENALPPLHHGGKPLFKNFKSLTGTKHYKVMEFNLESQTFLSSTDPKAQVSFSNRNLSVECRHCCKLFTFSPELLDQFLPKLAQSIIE